MRKEVRVFAGLMELKLQENDKKRGKTGWKGDKKLGLKPVNPVILSIRICRQMDKYIATGKRSHLVNVANYCMMLHDIKGK
jgi:hypothetical protein